MYYEYFGLNYPPFKITPDTRLFYSGSNRGLLLDALVYAIKTGEGIIKVVGEVGSGKTMLCRMLEDKLPKNIEIVYLANPHLEPDMVLHAIALEMRLPISPRDNRVQIMHALHTRLLEKHANNKQVVVFIEEAQGMPLETLEEIRLLSNLETTRNKLLQIVLFGQPELDTHLSIATMRQLKERITHSFYLDVLTQAEIRDYLSFRLHAVGYRGTPIFSPAAVRLLTKVSKGIMRRINVLANKALLAAFANEVYIISPKQIRLAAHDSGFPCPRFSKGIGIGILMVLIVIASTLGFGGENIWAYFKHRLETTAHSENTSPPIITTVSLLQKRIQATEQWLARANKQHYSIQLLQTPEIQTKSLNSFLRLPEIQPLLEELYIYRIKIKGQIFWEMMYSEFSYIDSATAAMATLPKVLQRNKPFLRRIADLRIYNGGGDI